jgi:hypothetical protein
VADRRSAEIESLKNELLRYAARKTEIPDASEDWPSSLESQISNASANLLREKLHNIFGLVDKTKDAAAIYETLDFIIIAAMMVGAHRPSEAIETLHRIRKTEEAREAREASPARVAVRKRRELMRPLVEEIANDFAHHPERERVMAVRRALLKRDDFIRLLPKALKDPRFIKSDIEAILLSSES